MTLLVIGGMFALTFAVLSLPPIPARYFRWAEGWMIPHAEPRQRCLVKCATCERN